MRNVKRGRNKARLAVCAAFVLLAAIVAIAGIFAADQDDSIASAYDITKGGNVMEARVTPAAPAGQDRVRSISINKTPVFETGLSEGSLGIVNEKTNPFSQVVEIYVNDGDKLVYRSGIIPAGGHTDSGRLMENLSAGEYSCRACFYDVDASTGKIINMFDTDITLTVNR